MWYTFSWKIVNHFLYTIMIISYFTRYSLLLLSEASWTGPNVHFTRCTKYDQTSLVNTAQSLTTFCSHSISFYTYLHRIYIKLIKLHEKIMNFGALKWFGYVIKQLKKSIELYQQYHLYLQYWITCPHWQLHHQFQLSVF